MTVKYDELKQIARLCEYEKRPNISLKKIKERKERAQHLLSKTKQPLN